MDNEKLIEKIRKNLFKFGDYNLNLTNALLSDAAYALENAAKRADSDAKIIHDLQWNLDAAWKENRELKKRLADRDVHGKWLGTADGYADGELVYDMWECSNCGYDADGVEEKPIWKFCPKCGARMDLEVDDG